MSTKKAKTRPGKFPSEINWLRSETSIVSHIGFFNFFESYEKRKANLRFLKVISFMEDERKKAEVLENYYKWRRSDAAKEYWVKRDQKRQTDQNYNDLATSNSIGASSCSCSSSATSTTSVQSISLAEAKELMVPKITIANNSSSNQNYVQSLTNFKHGIFESLDTSLLSFEANLQHLLALSNIMFIRKYSYHPDLEIHFTESICDFRQNLYDSVGYDCSIDEFPKDTMLDIITIVNNINCGLIDKSIANNKMSNLINEQKGHIVIKLLSSIRSMIDVLPMRNQKKNVEESELCTRYLQPLFQKLFDSSNGDFLFKWTNTLPLIDDSNDKKRPDGLVENDHKVIGYFEVKAIKHVKDHKKVNIDLHRLCLFSKRAITKFKLKHTFQVMAIGKFTIIVANLAY